MIRNSYFTKDLCVLCEFMYRKGAYDSVLATDKSKVNELYQRYDGYSTFQFLDEEVIYFENYDLYLDRITVYMNKFNCTYLRKFLNSDLGKKYSKGVCVMAEYSYRRGIKDGCKADVEYTVKWYESLERSRTYKKLLSKGAFNLLEHKDWTKYHCAIAMSDILNQNVKKQVNRIRKAIHKSIKEDYSV